MAAYSEARAKIQTRIDANRPLNSDIPTYRKDKITVIAYYPDGREYRIDKEGPDAFADAFSCLKINTTVGPQKDLVTLAFAQALMASLQMQPAEEQDRRLLEILKLARSR